MNVDQSTKFEKDNKQFPLSATLPISRNFSLLNDQFRKSNQEINSQIGRLRECDSNLNAACLVCFDKPPNAVFMDCGHGGLFYKSIFYYFLIIL